MTFNWLFVGTSVGFVISAVLVLSTRIPNAAPSQQAGAWNRVTSGVKVFFATPRLHGVMALTLVVAAARSIVAPRHRRRHRSAGTMGPREKETEAADDSLDAERAIVDLALNDEAEAAESTLVACQRACVCTA